MLDFKPSGPTDFEDTFGLNFQIQYDYYGEMRVVDLIPNGGDKTVTEKNRKGL